MKSNEPFDLARLEIFDQDDEASTSSADDEEGMPAGSEPNPFEEVKALAQTETSRMKIWKIFVVLSILLTGCGVSSGVYIFLSERQNDEFENRFYVHSSSIADVTKIQTDSMDDALDDLATEITSYAKISNSTFPFVTMPNFEVNAHNARRHSKAEIIYLAHMVTPDQQRAYENYTVEHQGWIKESRELELRGQGDLDTTVYQNAPILPYLFTSDTTGNFMPVQSKELYTPAWQFSPAPFNPFLTNYDAYFGHYKLCVDRMVETKRHAFTQVIPVAWLSGTATSNEDHEAYHGQFVNLDGNRSSFEHPHATLSTPVFRELNNAKDSDVAAYLVSVIAFDRYVGNSIQGSKGTYLGPEDLHDPKYDDMVVRIPFSDEETGVNNTRSLGYCVYEWRVYPSDEFKASTEDSLTIMFTAVSACVFFVIAVTFFMYDSFVQRRNHVVIDAAAKSNALVLSLFPAHIRDKLLKQKDWSNEEKNRKQSVRGLKGFLNEKANADGQNQRLHAKPIAELFPAATVMFGDIAGFTAWSSVREPAQVFMLLENLYSTFDKVAKKRRVFKVETVGDCYVAVAGLPDPRHDHAVVMSRFARDCMFRMREVIQRLELELGPDTRELTLRVGLHSGPVTAGVLRGDRARFQLFGDTVNTTARMESTGVPGRIQISRDTADLLIAHGKQDWLVKREDVVNAKGKGEVETFWLNVRDQDNRSAFSGDMSETMESISDNGSDMGRITILTSEKSSSLVKYNVEVLTRLLEQILANRKWMKRVSSKHPPSATSGKTPLDEVVEVISLPQQSIKSTGKVPRLPGEVKKELSSFIRDIAALYHGNAFHNFEHASHVTMSVVKLMSRIVAPSDNELPPQTDDETEREAILHDHTYGITSDPLTQFACVFSALIHDVDHTGVPNSQLVKESAVIASYYNGRSVAEQNSVDLAWDLFMREDYSMLRHAICANESELKRFRQLVVNAVMATDIMDKDLKRLRNQRWEKAFSAMEGATGESDATARNRKATIVIEHLIQASDVAHTMQHWHVYRKWNERLFIEIAKAYEDGRADKHPADFWYNGELGFFDYYIIPLAKKLKDCGVFGVSSDEYLNYALKNRKEWEARGKEIVAEMRQQIETGFDVDPEVHSLLQQEMTRQLDPTN